MGVQLLSGDEPHLALLTRVRVQVLITADVFHTGKNDRLSRNEGETCKK